MSNTPTTVTYWAKSILTSKTAIFNALVLIAEALTMSEVAILIPPSWQPRVIALVAVINIVIRKFTVRPVAMISPGDVKKVEVEKIT